MRDAALDLLLGGRCVGCGAPGRVLCPGCRGSLPVHAAETRPTPAPEGLVRCFAAAEYDGVPRALVLGLKERRLLGLTGPLAGLLAASVLAALETVDGPVVLVPVPSRTATVRARGHDATAAVTRGAARLLRRTGHDVLAVPLLRLRPGVVDQSGLDAAARAANLAGSMACRTPALGRLAAARPRASAVVCDDVLTTGATAREAQRALEAVGLHVAGVAAVAATRRRTPPVLSAGLSLS